ncbi:MAG: CDP-alcohol phosphatidyltransferase family protein [Candidatus Krumholzibacteria bacterium]|nr:CDP-alcohol phosphatidyltransferase family protein [Candidatus Krumholzibacteria bacterium]
MVYARARLRVAASNVRSNRSLTITVIRFVVFCQLGVICLLAPVYLRTGAIHFLQKAFVAAAANVPLAFFLVFSAGLLLTGDRPKLGLANRLTIVRFVLVVPLVMFVVDEAFIAALIVYGTVLATDVLDGIAARLKGEKTEFGTIMDPLADIASTAALYGAFLFHGFIPLWVFLILMARYVTLFAGSVALFLIVGPLRFRATPVGKIVGVLQGAAGIMILALAGAGVQWLDNIGVTLFGFLGIIFGSVIVSQLVIAIGMVRSGARCRILKAI